ncbi:hypothetical protein AAFC00_003956 [Neodothiora populina]|uniref:NmrA-like domain-containing protein n=1 Tax=Neodothiora populina TaxID=2781224 RepID=A0ABR3PI20_9PEZI
MSATRNILIFGGTGVIGKFITDALITARSAFGDIAIFTSQTTVESKKAQLEQWQSRGLKVIVGDLAKQEDVLKAYESFDTVVSAVGRNVIASQIDLIRWAEASSTIKRFFPSEYGTDIEYDPIKSPHEKPHQLKLQVRAYIREHIKRLEYTYLVTGPYADLFITKSKNAEYGSFDPGSKTATLLGTGDEKISLTTMEDVGKLLVAALKHPAPSKNKALKVNSFTTTGHEILHEFENQTGGAKWQVNYTSLPKLKELEKNAWESCNPVATVYTLRRIWTEGGTLYNESDNAKIGNPEMDSLGKVVSKVIASST